MARDGWSALFESAFKQSKNPMALVDDQRRHVDANAAYLRLLGRTRDEVLGTHVWSFVAGGPLLTTSEWKAALAAHRFHGEAELVGADGVHVGVQWAGATEVVTGRRLVLFVALSTSRWGASFRRSMEIDREPGELSARELEIVRLIARGESGPEIAAELHLAHDTVRTHVRNAMRKVGARSRAHLVAKVLGEGHALA
jgi:PAS domain S-box-containing protein